MVSTSAASFVVATRLGFVLLITTVLLTCIRAGPVALPSDRLKHVLLRESEGYHDEVWAPLLTDLAASHFIKTTFSRHSHRWNMPSITDRIQFYSPATLQGSGYSDKNEFSITPANLNHNKIDYLLDVSCNADLLRRPRQFKRLFDETNVHLLCVNHHAHPDAAAIHQYHNVTKRFIDADRITFLVLSEHVGKTLNKHLQAHGSKPINYHVYVPVFELPQEIDIAQNEKKRKQFVIQGNFEPGRRNYDSVFQHFRQGLASYPPDTLPSDKPKLVLIGSGPKPTLPKDIEPFIEVHANLEYPEYYKTLGRSAVILPAFSTESYYHERGSSTINAGIIGSTVIVGDQKLLDSYTFLDDKVVFVTQPGESDVQAAMRFLAARPEERNSRLKYLQEFRHGIIRQNRELLDRLINPEAVAHSQKPTSVIGKYVQSAQTIASEHPHSSGGGFVIILGLILGVIFRASLVKLYRNVRSQYLGKRTVNAAGEYIPVSMSEAHTPITPVKAA